MWPLIHEAERRMEGLVARFPDAQGEQLEVLKQAARELLLLESSDWPFLIDTRQAAEYATHRFQGHLARFNRLALLAEKEALDEEDRAFLQECQRLDNPFLNIDYRLFAAREGQAG
jgi:1,4-alpha-glucan branching enzyme